MATISGQNEQDERAQAIPQLKSRRAAKQAELARIDETLAAAEDHDFHARLGREQLKTLDARQIRNRQPAWFAEILGIDRREVTRHGWPAG